MKVPLLRHLVSVMNCLSKLLLVLLLLTAARSFAADQTISFNNNNLGSPRLVTFDSTTGALAGTGVRNGVFDGASYVAQLFRLLPDGSEVAIGARANFRASTTTQPGTWSGGTRTVTGVERGTLLVLKVKVWDNSVASYEASCGPGLLRGESVPFLFQDPLNNPPGATDNFMFNFQGFAIQCMPEPDTIALGLLGSLFVLWLPRKR